MTRLPPSQKLLELAKLTRTREQVALGRLADADAERRRAAQGIAELRDTRHEVETTEQAALLARWMLWRDQELARRNAKLAVLEARLAIIKRDCGRAVAEHAVVEKLILDAKRQEARMRDRAAHIS